MNYTFNYFTDGLKKKQKVTKAEKLAIVLFPDLTVIPVFSFSNTPVFFKVSGQWLAPLISPTPLITLSLSQQWSVA